MSKAQNAKFTASLTEEQKTSDKAVFDDALESMKVFAGKDAEYVMMLKEKMQARGQAKLDVIQDVVGLLTKLLKGTEEEREEARNKIKALSSEKQPTTEEDEAEQAEVIKNLEDKESEIQDMLENQLSHGAGAIEDEDKESQDALGGNSTALVERYGDLGQVTEAVSKEVDQLLHGIAFILLIWLVVCAIIWAVHVALSVMIGLILVILVGCGAFTLGEGHDGRAVPRETFRCMKELFIYPIREGANALKWVWDEFKPSSW